MHNKTIVLLVVLLSVCMLLITGCSKKTLEVEQASNQSTQRTEAFQEMTVSPTPSEEPVQPTTTPSSESPNSDDASSI